MLIDYTNTFILEALHLPVISDLNSLSDCLGLSERIIYLLTQKTSNYYEKFYRPKKNGGQREIVSPSYSLKLVQRWILVEILNKLPVSDVAYAYVKGNGLGIKRNADLHKNSLYILELDFKGFFPSISRERVFYLFKNIGYNTFVSNVLANLCTFEGTLPQGGVCSPSISNIVCYKLDKRLKNLCSKRELIYSRYADDLAISSDNKSTLIKTFNLIEKIVNAEGFFLNPDKTRYLSPKSHKVVTGITVDNGILKARKELKKRLRAMIFRSIVSKDYSQNEQIRGIIAYIDSIEKGYKTKMIEYLNAIGMKKDFVYFEDLVQEFNSHKIFKELMDMPYKGGELPPELEGDVFADILEIREEYLNRIGFKARGNVTTINTKKIKREIHN